MNRDDLDEILSKQDEIVPSSGFASSVMDGVRQEASTPPPIPFPWKRALPGFAAAAVALGLILFSLVKLVGAADFQLDAPSSSTLTGVLQTLVDVRAEWIGISLLVTLASVALSLRMASKRN